jgi:hypothetical protein
VFSSSNKISNVQTWIFKNRDRKFFVFCAWGEGEIGLDPLKRRKKIKDKKLLFSIENCNFPRLCAIRLLSTLM